MEPTQEKETENCVSHGIVPAIAATPLRLLTVPPSFPPPAAATRTTQSTTTLPGLKDVCNELITHRIK